MSADDDLEGQFPSLEGRGPRQLIEAMTAVGPVGVAWLPYAKAIVEEGRLPPALRELVVLRVAWHHRSEYVWGGHVLMAEDENLVLDPLVEWSAEQDLAVTVVDDLVISGRLKESTRALAFRQWPRGVLLEMVMVIGQYIMLSLVDDVLQLSAEPGCPALPPVWLGPGAGR